MTGAAQDRSVDGADTAELVAQLSRLAGADPAGVRQVVAEVLTALDRAAGGALREHLPEAIRLDLDPDRPGSATPGGLRGPVAPGPPAS